MMHSLLAVSLVLGLVLLTGCASAGGHPATRIDAQGGLLYRSLKVDGVERRYAISVPRGFAEDPKPARPLIVFLNGSGECGTDGSKQAVVGLGSAALLKPEAWPFIIVYPQKPDQKSQWGDHDALVMATLEATRREFNIDPSRIYLTGLSQGGAGAWALGAHHTDLFAAIAPICGYGDPALVAAPLKNTPVWAFHGEKDDVVPPEQTRAIVAAIRNAGGKPKATYLPNANHNSWDSAYRDSNLGAWLLEHTLPAAGK